MKLNTKLILLLIVHCSFLIVITSCKKEQQYSITPNIQFQNFTKFSDGNGVDQTGNLLLSFTDGDGDIGLSAGDTISPYVGLYYYDFFAAYYELQFGKLTAVKLPASFNSRLPLITINGSNKNVKGTIQIALYIYNSTSKFDTIAFQVYIVDRALHKSNIIMTPNIIVKRK